LFVSGLFPCYINLVLRAGFGSNVKYSSFAFVSKIQIKKAEEKTTTTSTLQVTTTREVDANGRERVQTQTETTSHERTTRVVRSGENGRLLSVSNCGDKPNFRF
jgi:hypothetical protein